MSEPTRPTATTSSAFPDRWAPARPDHIQLYSLATPNGQKVAIALEETGLDYEAHKIDILSGDQFDDQYVEINPNSKIPSIIDPNGPDGKPIAMMESGCILLYLADKSGKLIPTDARGRWEVTQWVFFQMASVGPMFGQFGHFHKFAADKTTDDYALERYTAEAKRLLGVLDRRLASREFIVGEFSVADIAMFPWIKALDFYEGKDKLDYSSFENIEPWVERCHERPAVQRGLEVTPFG